MSLELRTDRGSVTASYGARDIDRNVGKYTSKDDVRRMSIDLSGQVLSDKILPALTLDAGCSIINAFIDVSEVFVVAASSVVEIGESGLESTNGVSILEADLESTGRVDLTSQLAGEFAANSKIPDDVTLALVFSAGSVTTATAGKAKLVIEYVKD